MGVISVGKIFGGEQQSWSDVIRGIGGIFGGLWFLDEGVCMAIRGCLIG